MMCFTGHLVDFVEGEGEARKDCKKCHHSEGRHLLNVLIHDLRSELFNANLDLVKLKNNNGQLVSAVVVGILWYLQSLGRVVGPGLGFSWSHIYPSFHSTFDPPR